MPKISSNFSVSHLSLSDFFPFSWFISIFLSHVPRFSLILPSFRIFSRRPCGRALGLTGHVLGPGAGGPFLGRRRLSAAGGATGGRERVEPARGGGRFLFIILGGYTTGIYLGKL